MRMHSRETREQRSAPVQVRSNTGAHAGRVGGMLALQQHAGNRAVSELLRPISSSTRSGAGSGGPGCAERTPERLVIQQDTAAARILSGAGAYAAARGDRILARNGAFGGADGSFRFAHEVAHVLQQSAAGLPAGSPEQAEGDADRFARETTRGRSSAVAFSAPKAWAFDRRRVPSDDRVVSIVIVGKRATITIRSADGGEYTISPTVNHNLPARDDPYTVIDGTFIAELAKQKRVYFNFSFRAGVPGFGPEHFPHEVPLTVKRSGKAFSGGGGKKGKQQGKPGGAGTAAGPKGTTGTGKTDKPAAGKAPGEGGKGAPAPGGVKGGKGEGSTAIEGAIQGEVTDKVPVVTVKDAKQVEELKKRGLIPARTADEIKAKLDRKETLSFEEAVTLVDALNQFVQGEKTDETARKDARESWLKWAKFIEENKENLSGAVKAGKDGITVQEVKQILAKHKKFIGVKDAPQRTTKKALYDPELRKSWNNLADWEKDLWKDYVKKYGNTADVTDASSKDLRITKAVRFSMALRMSPQYMKPGAREAAQQLFNDPIFIGATMAGIAAYLALWLVPEPVFSKAAAVMTTLALLSLISFSVMEIKNLASAWMRLSDESAAATTLEELEEAAEHFGKSIGGSGLRILVALATVVAGKLLPAPKAAPPSTGGGLAGAGAGGGTVVVPQARAVPTIKVLKDGTVVILGPGSGVAMSSTKGGGTGGPKPKGGGTQKAPTKKTESKEEARRRELAEVMAEDIGRGKRPEVPEGTEAKPSANPRTAALEPEVVLRHAMERGGVRVPEGHDAHHMVPKKGGGRWGDRARAVLRRVGIGINEADNGVPLPRTSTDPATIPEAVTRHATVHTEKYYRALARRLEKAEPSEERIRALLRAIRVEITEGEFPH